MLFTSTIAKTKEDEVEGHRRINKEEEVKSNKSESVNIDKGVIRTRK